MSRFKLERFDQQRSFGQTVELSFQGPRTVFKKIHQSNEKDMRVIEIDEFKIVQNDDKPPNSSSKWIFSLRLQFDGEYLKVNLVFYQVCLNVSQ